MKYNINERPKTIKEWLLFACQQVMSVFIATILIAKICGTPISSCLVGAGIGTFIYLLCTDYKSPVFISSCGATAGAIISALALGGYIAAAIGGFIMFSVYLIIAFLVKKKGLAIINKIMPIHIIGAITMVIGINLAGFIPTYLQVNGETLQAAVIVALITMVAIALLANYGKGIIKNIPFLLGLLIGYGVALVLTILNVAPLIDLSIFNDMKLFIIPDFTFKYWDFSKVDLALLIELLVLFIPVSLAGICEHYSDHMVLSNIIGTDLTKEPGLDKTLLGDGLASFIGTILCGLPNTTYGESIATVGFSKVASTAVIGLAAIIIEILAFIGPIQYFILSIPSCVFAGAAMILYGYIASSGLKTLINNKVDLDNSKNLITVSVIITTGVSGIYLFNSAFSGVSIALVLGIILNKIL